VRVVGNGRAASAFRITRIGATLLGRHVSGSYFHEVEVKRFRECLV
jgi:hypothetical protein